jgi:hypothetical protein
MPQVPGYFAVHRPSALTSGRARMSCRSVDSSATMKGTYSAQWWEELSVRLRGDLTAPQSGSSWEAHFGDWSALM